MEIILAIHNIRSIYNVGSILRTCDGFGVKKVIYSGFTPVPIQISPELPHIANKITEKLHKTALGAETTLCSEYSADIKATIKQYKDQGYQIIGLENNLKDQLPFQITDPTLKSKLTPKILIIVGEEVSGISSELFSLIDFFLEIPMHGEKESFNVSVATAILLFVLTNQVLTDQNL